MALQPILYRLRQQLREQLPVLSAQYGVESLAIFGSFVRGEQGDDSDLDILVTFHTTPGLLKFIALENYLSDLLGVKVDLVMKESLKPSIGSRIISEAMPV